MSKSVIVFSGYNQRAVIAFLRTLTARHVSYAIIAASDQDTIFDTEYAAGVAGTRRIKPLDLEDILAQIDIARKRLPSTGYVLAPSTEALNRFFIDHRQHFEEAGCDVPLVDGGLYREISDKYAFNSLCLRNGIRVPREYASLDETRLPYVAKPRAYVSGDGKAISPILVHTDTDAKEFSEQYDTKDFYYQEYVEGRSIYLLYYFYKDGTVMKFSQENYIQQPGGKSIVGAITSDFHMTDESSKYERLFQASGFTGLSMVEVKVADGDPVMIECNPRFWGPSQLFVDAGVNLYDAFLYDTGCVDSRPDDIPATSQARYFWYGGVIQAMALEDTITYHNYTSTDFAIEMSEWLVSDVYNREDTRGLFKREAKL